MTGPPIIDTNKQSRSPEPHVDAVSYQTLTIDYALYEQYLENADLTEEQKREFLDTLWNIIVNFVDLGFGVHPLQQVTKPNDIGSACEQNAIPPEYLTPDSSDVVSLETLIKTGFIEMEDAQSGASSGKEDS